MNTSKEKHILGLSGGKDSAALALFMRQNYPDLKVEYFFTDTGSELPEVYDYLDKLESQLAQPIKRLRAKDVHEGIDATENTIFGELFKNVYNGFLPSPQARWCTVQMKLKPLEKWIKPMIEEGNVIFSYIAIRADEDRLGYNPPNPTIKPKFPFMEEGIDIFGVEQILENSGIGRPPYYDWRSRSGCTFCFYQQKIEWVGLLEKHPDKYREAIEFEKFSMATSKSEGSSEFTWSRGESLEELAAPSRVKQIKIDYEKRKERLLKKRRNPLRPEKSCGLDDVDDIYGSTLEPSVCVVCHK